MGLFDLEEKYHLNYFYFSSVYQIVLCPLQQLYTEVHHSLTCCLQ